ncbi:MAG: DUF1800 domain-containing protein [Saprospiraceae bacterium]|nr:DUF1800 domain-containing protein [Saprospiraceae bacterium]
MPTHADFPEKITHNQVAVEDPLQPYVPSAEKPWTARRVAHLYRRLGFGASLAQIQQGLQMSPSELVDQLLDNVADLGTPDPPYWAGYTSDDYDADPDSVFTHRREMRNRWLSEMLEEGIRAKMALFWHNHFATELIDYQCNAYMWDYYSLLHEHAFGNFKVFVREMGKNAAMLDYLNGNLNVAGSPNENYARELMELFTMGEGNGYTQSDIVEMARALTGWQAKAYLCTPAYYDATRHDNGVKTIFGQSGNFNFTSAHNLIFTARAQQVAHFIPSKIYKNFVYQYPDPQVIDGLAQTFQNNNWELLPMLKQLFKSEHFFDDQFISARVKNPIESMIPLLKAGGVSAADMDTNWWNAIGYWSFLLGQEIFNPPNVSGWAGYRAWINESTMTARWKFNSSVAYYMTVKEPLRENLRNLAITLSNDSNDPQVIVAALVEHFLGQTLEPVHLNAAVSYFKSGIPENYFLDGSWNLYWDEAPYQVVNMLYYLVKLPEYQLT